jgi:hypothetical protein
VDLLSSGHNGFNDVIKSDFKGSKIRQELTNFLALEEKHQAHYRCYRRRVWGSKPTPPSFTERCEIAGALCWQAVVKLQL